MEGWAVLMEINDFPEGYTDLPVDFVDIERLQNMLVHHKWQKNHILVKKDMIAQETVREGLQYLKENADANDIVLFYIGSHGEYILYDLKWNEIFPSLWEEITTEKRVLIVDSCFSEYFLPKSDNPHISIASVSKGEAAWAGLPEEGLPITGFLFTYYFCESMKEDISVEEGFERTVPKVKDYMREIVYPKFKDVFPAEVYNNLYDPNPVIDDKYPGALHLDVERESPVSLFLVLVGMALALKKTG